MEKHATDTANANQPSELVLDRFINRHDADGLTIHQAIVGSSRVVVTLLRPIVVLLSEKESFGRAKGDNRPDCRFQIDRAVAKLLS